MNKTGIEYLTHTWNPIAMRCTPISEGCANCWHLTRADMLAKNPKIPEDRRNAYAGTGNPVLIKKELLAPLKRKKPGIIGVQFMGDVFHENVHRDYFLEILLVIRKCPQHTFIILTKRPERMVRIIGWSKPAEALADETLKVKSFPGNIIGMVTIENQKRADERLPFLFQSPFGVYGVSIEPCLGNINLGLLEDYDPIGGLRSRRDMLDWVIAGGESGPGARPMHPDWARSIRDQCQSADVPFFFKQWGEYVESIPSNESSASRHIYTHDTSFYRVGKKRAGRILDDRIWSEIPNA